MSTVELHAFLLHFCLRKESAFVAMQVLSSSGFLLQEMCNVTVPRADSGCKVMVEMDESGMPPKQDFEPKLPPQKKNYPRMEGRRIAIRTAPFSVPCYQRCGSGKILNGSDSDSGSEQNPHVRSGSDCRQNVPALRLHRRFKFWLRIPVLYYEKYF